MIIGLFFIRVIRADFTFVPLYKQMYLNTAKKDKTSKNREKNNSILIQLK